MKRKGFIKARYLLFFSLLVVLLILPYKYLLAIPVVIQKDYTYQASELDSKVSCRAIALEQVKRLVLEEVGSHVISKTVVKNNEIDSDQVRAITAGTVKTKIIEEDWDGLKYYVKASCEVDPEEVEKSINKVINDENQVAELESTNQRIAELMETIEKLKTQIAAEGSDPSAGPQYAAAQYNDAVNEVSSMNMVQDSYVDMNNGNYTEALSTLEKANELNPLALLAPILIAKSVVYQNTNNYAQAQQQLNMVEQRAPTPEISKRVALQRAGIYMQTGDNSKALTEINKSINIDKDNPHAYRQRAKVYHIQGDRQKENEDIRRARTVQIEQRHRETEKRKRPAQPPTTVVHLPPKGPVPSIGAVRPPSDQQIPQRPARPGQPVLTDVRKDQPQTKPGEVRDGRKDHRPLTPAEERRLAEERRQKELTEKRDRQEHRPGDVRDGRKDQKPLTPAEERKLAAEQKRTEQQEKREQQRLAAEKKKEDQRLAEENRKKELAEKREQQRLAVEKRKEEQRLAEENRKKELTEKREQQRLAAEQKKKEEADRQRERLERQRQEQERQLRERQERARQQQERQEKARQEQERQQRERLDQARQKERELRERQDQMRREQERQQRERQDQARQEQERQQRDRQDQMRRDQERQQRDRQDQMRRDQERQQRERQEQMRREQERQQYERQQRQQQEQERQKREKARREQEQREQQERDRQERYRQEQERRQQQQQQQDYQRQRRR